MQIYHKNDLSGTGYIELAKGQRKESPQCEDSVYFLEEDFVPFELIFGKLNSKYRPFGRTSFDDKVSKLIIQELHLLIEAVNARKTVTEALKALDYDIYVLSNSALDKLNSVIPDEIAFVAKKLVEWIEQAISNDNGFSVLGL